jgi:hypothetical protein
MLTATATAYGENTEDGNGHGHGNGLATEGLSWPLAATKSKNQMGITWIFGLHGLTARIF